MSASNKGGLPTQKSGFYYGYIIVLAAFFIGLIVFGIRLTYGIFFNPMAAQFGWDSATVSSVFSVSILIEGTSGFIMGKLIDRFGPRLVITLCGASLGVGYLLMASVTALWQMYLFYGVLVGIGMGGMIVPILTTVSRWFVYRRALITGIVLSSTGIGGLIMSPLSEWIISNYSWQTAYLVSGLSVLVIVIVASQFLRRDPAAMGLSPYLKTSPGMEAPKPAPPDFALKQAVFTRQFWLLLMSLFIYGYIGYSFVVHFVPHTIDAGITPASAAFAMAVFGITGMVGRIIMGAMADKIGNKEVFIICFVLFAAGFVSLMVVRETWFFYLMGGLFGLTTGGILSTTAAFIAELFGLKFHGEIFGIIGLINTIGGAAGPLLAGYLFDVTGTYNIAFLVCAVLSLIAFVLTALITPTLPYASFSLKGKREI